MKRFWTALLAVCIIPAGLLADHHEGDSDSAMKKDSSVDQQQMAADQAEAMANFMKYSMPAEEHEHLAKGAGVWEVKQKFYMAPDQPPMETVGKETSRMILDGRVLQFDYHAMVMGMPMQGFGLMGYDLVREEWWSTWNDSMGTGIMYATGSYDEETETFHFEGTASDPIQVKEEVTVTFEIKILGPDEQVMTMWHDGEKSMVSHYTRVKDED